MTATVKQMLETTYTIFKQLHKYISQSDCYYRATIHVNGRL